MSIFSILFAMEVFDELLEVAETLNGPEGCPWDRKQTFESLRKYLLEESHELLEAIDNKDFDHMVEELGDVLYVLIFYTVLGAKHDKFTLEQVVKNVKEKLIHRHPHVFGDAKVDSVEDVLTVWNAAKKVEKKERTSLFEGIPHTFGSLFRAQKMLERLQKQNKSFPKGKTPLGSKLLKIVEEAGSEDIDSILREELLEIEKAEAESKTSL